MVFKRHLSVTEEIVSALREVVSNEDGSSGSLIFRATEPGIESSTSRSPVPELHERLRNILPLGVRVGFARAMKAEDVLLLNICANGVKLTNHLIRQCSIRFSCLEFDS